MGCLWEKYFGSMTVKKNRDRGAHLNQIGRGITSCRDPKLMLVGDFHDVFKLEGQSGGRGWISTCQSSRRSLR